MLFSPQMALDNVVAGVIAENGEKCEQPPKVQLEWRSGGASHAYIGGAGVPQPSPDQLPFDRVLFPR